MKLRWLTAMCLVMLGCKNGDSDKAGGDKVASCNSAAMFSCREYNAGNLAAGSDSLAKLCTVVDSTSKFAMVACPTAKLLGTCTKREDKDFYYEGYPIAVDKTAKDCTADGGTFARGK